MRAKRGAENHSGLVIVSAAILRQRLRDFVRDGRPAYHRDKGWPLCPALVKRDGGRSGSGYVEIEFVSLRRANQLGFRWKCRRCHDR